MRRVFEGSSSAPAYGYDSFGNALQATALPTDFGFAGMLYNAESGLYLTRYRAYDPLAGRWLSRDPLGEATDPASNLYAYVEGNPIGFADLLGLYDIVVVTTATGVVYRPMTTVKNSAQAAQYGQPLGSKVPIAVPPGVNPQAKVNSWADTLFQGTCAFAAYWWPGGQHDYKQTNAMYDAYGNFAYGATGAAAGYSCPTLTGLADLLHGGQSNLINTMDIQSGYNAISSGGTLSVSDYSPTAPN